MRTIRPAHPMQSRCQRRRERKRVLEMHRGCVDLGSAPRYANARPGCVRRLDSKRVMSQGAIARIEGVLEERFGGTARFVPSGRLALVIACEAFMQRGDNVAMIAPLCEVVAFAVYAAGMRPVFIDSSTASPNIDQALLRSLDRRQINGIIATNLFGIPDDLPRLQRLCRDRGWTLVEDCAQVLESHVEGQQVGTFGDVAIFSFAKYFDEMGAAVIYRDSTRLDRVEQLIQRYSVQPPPGARIRARTVQILRWSKAAWLENYARRILRELFPGSMSSPRPVTDTRLPISVDQFLTDTQVPDPLAGMDRYLSECGAKPYRELPPPARLERLLDKLLDWDQMVLSVREANRKLRQQCPLVDLRLPDAVDPCYLRVPFLTGRRDIIAALAWRTEGVRTECIYNPPLPEYLPAATFGDVRRFPKRDQRWSREILPIHPLHAQPFLRAISKSSALPASLSAS